MSNLKNLKNPNEMSEAELDAEIAQLQSQDAPALKNPNEMTEAELDAEIAQLQAGIPKDDNSAAAFGRGTLQGVTLNMEDEVRAAANTAMDLLQNPNAKLSDTAAIYRRHKDVQDAELKRLQMESPTAFTAGEVTGSVGTTFFGGPLAKVAGNTLKSAIAAGGLSALGRAEDLTDVSGMALGAAGGAAGFGLGGVVGSAVGRTAGKLATATRGITKAITGGVDDITARAHALISSFGVNGKASFRKLNDMLDRRGVSKEVLVQDILEDVPMSNITNPRELLDGLDVAQERLGKGIGDIKDQVDDAVPEGAIDTAALADVLQDEVRQTLLGKTQEEVTNILDSIAPVLRAAERTPKMKLSEASALQKRIADRISRNKVGSDNNQVRIEIERVLREQISDQVEGHLGVEALETFRILRRKYGNVVEMKPFMKGAIAQYDSDLQNFGLDSMDLKSRLEKLWNTDTGLSPTKMVGAVINTLRTAPPKYEALAKFQSLNRIITKMEQAPGRYAKHANRIVLGASRSTEDMLNALGLVDSEMELEESPIQRTTADVVQKAPQILNILNDRNPDLAKSLQDALESGDSDAIDSMLSSLSRLPEGKQFFAPGVGMNGRAVTDMDITETISTIKQVYGSDPMRRAQELEKFNATKELPDFTVPGMTQEDIFIQNQLKNRRGPKTPNL